MVVHPHLGQRLARTAPELTPRILEIPYGVEIPDGLPPRRSGPLRLAYAGRLEHDQKRALDLLRIADALDARGVSYHLTILGDGPERDTFREAATRSNRAGTIELAGVVPPDRVLEEVAETDVLLLCSRFEGLPLALLEGMSRGCIPVVTDLPTIPRSLVRHGETGFRVPVGDCEAFAEHLQRVAGNERERGALARRAQEAVRAAGYSAERMVNAYRDLAGRLSAEAREPNLTGERGSPRPPPTEGWKDTLPPAIRAAGRRVFRALSGLETRARGGEPSR